MNILQGRILTDEDRYPYLLALQGYMLEQIDDPRHPLMPMLDIINTWVLEYETERLAMMPQMRRRDARRHLKQLCA